MAASSSSTSPLLEQPGKRGWVALLDDDSVVPWSHDETAMVVHERSSSAAPTPVVVRKAWRCFDGCFDGDSEDSDDEYAADDAKRARNNSSARSKPIYATNVRLLPRAGGSRSITVVATADLHRHHADKYIDGNSKSLAEYFESALAPAHVDVVLMAGDLGLDLNEELSTRSRGLDKPATGVLVSPRENDAKILQSFNELLRRIVRAKPMARVFLCAGNHDGLLCSDDSCLACHHPRLHRCMDGEGWWQSPSDAACWARKLLLEGVADRVAVLTDDHADFTAACGVPVRVVGSPWTTYSTHGKEHISPCHFWRPEDGQIFGGRQLLESLVGGGAGFEPRLDCDEWWRDHWRRIGQQLEGTPPGGVPLLVTHTPPLGVLDSVSGCAGRSRERRVGDRALSEMLQTLRAPPRLHAFGHVHAIQSREERPEGPRLCASKRVPQCCFANVAAERSLPAITGHRLLRSATAAAAAAAAAAAPAAAAAGAQLRGSDLLQSGALEMQTLTLAEWKPEPNAPLMRPPTVVVLPVDGWDVEDDDLWQAAWR